MFTITSGRFNPAHKEQLYNFQDNHCHNIFQFDDKVEGLLPFLRNQSCPVIVTNLNTSMVPQVLRMLIVMVVVVVVEVVEVGMVVVEVVVVVMMVMFSSSLGGNSTAGLSI